MSIKQLVLIYILAFILQLSLLNLISIGGVTPNLILCFTVVIIFRFPLGFKCIPFALVASLLLEICSSAYVGVGTIALFAVAAATVWARHTINHELYKAMAVVGAVATLLYGVVGWIVLAFLQTNYSFGYMLKMQPGYILFNLAIMLIIYFFTSDKFIEHREERI